MPGQKSQSDASDYELVLAEQNPWHTTGRVPDELACPTERPVGQVLWRRLLEDRPRRYQLVLGPRRVGKTTCLYQTVRRLLGAGVEARRLWWLRLDHPMLAQAPLMDLIRYVTKAAGACDGQPVYLFLDELTYAERWDLCLKTFYDEHWPVRIAASSSATAALRDRRMDSGVGRWEEQYLSPCLLGEFLSLVGRAGDVPTGDNLGETLDKCIRRRPDVVAIGPLRRALMLTGGFPELLMQACRNSTGITADMLLRSQRTLRDDAVDRAVYKDIPQAFGIDDPMLLERMLYTLAGQIGGVLSPTDLSRTLGFTQPTFDRYLSYLIRAFLVFTLANYAGSEATRQKRGRKLFFVDGALRNAALQRGLLPLSDPGEEGILLENLVAAHLHALSEQTRVRLHYWREKGAEVDLIYDHPSAPLAFEIARGSRHSRSGLHALAGRFERFRGKGYIVSPGVHPIAPQDARDRIGTLPLDMLLLAVSAQSRRELEARLTTSA